MNQLKPQDLRYGNLIEYNGKIFTVKAIEAFIVTVTRGKGNVEFTYAEINPVLLTEEILLMAGFEKNKRWEWETESYSIGKFRITKLDDGCYRELWMNGSYGADPEYQVHDDENPILTINQLQNLIHSMTGEELEINLK